MFRSLTVTLCHTTLSFVPPETTSSVKPLDVLVNAEFKHVVEQLQNQHVHSNAQM